MENGFISFSIDYDMFMTSAWCGLLFAVTVLLIGILADIKNYFFKKTDLKPLELLFDTFIKCPVMCVYIGSALYTGSNIVAFIASFFDSDYGVYSISIIPLIIFILSHYLFILIKEKSETLNPLNE
jgi:hypothetical protein